jgi:hypothetical protein
LPFGISTAEERQASLQEIRQRKKERKKGNAKRRN